MLLGSGFDIFLVNGSIHPLVGCTIVHITILMLLGCSQYFFLLL